jgi:CRISPR-associated protein Cmr1
MHSPDVEATFRIVTPMFLGGAEQQADRLRESSFKGGLVFWWRALNFPRLVKIYGDNNKALDILRSREQEIFGGQDAQSTILLRLMPTSPLKTWKPNHVLQAGQRPMGEGARYFGYGLMEAFGSRKDGTQAGELSRSCLQPGQDFTARLWFRPHSGNEKREDRTRTASIEQAEIAEALKLFGLVGGLGSRVRRGYGSIAMTNMAWNEHTWRAPDSLKAYVSMLKAIIEPAAQVPGKTMLITAFASESRCYVTTEGREPLRILSDMAAGMIRYRSWGRNGRYGGIRVEQNFTGDHDWYRVQNGRPDRPSDRAAFGLPVNYSKALSVTGPKDLDRRASPLSFHVHQLPNGTSFGVLLLLPTKFMPDDVVAISRNGRKSRPIRYDFSAKGLKVLTDFLDGRRPDGTRPSEPYIAMTRVL